MDQLKRLVKAAKDDPMVKAFIADALSKQVNAVLACKESEWPDHCIVTLPAWKRAATVIQGIIN